MELDPKFKEWASQIRNEGTPDVAPIPPRSGGSGQGGMITDLQRLFLESNKVEDTSEYSYNTRDVSKKYAVTYKGVNNEEVYAQGQGWTDKMVNGVGKGLLLTGTTFLQSTVGLVNGLGTALVDGRAASFYDNDMNRSLDAINKEAEENWLPNYYTQAERDANWYSPSKLISANFFWDGIIKNLGFAVGAAASGQVFTNVLKGIPGAAKLFTSGRAAETLAATEEGLLAADKAAGTFGKIKSLSDKFVTGYASMNAGGRAVVAGLATTGEAGFEAFNNAKEFREKKIEEYRATHSGLDPTEAELAEINQLADEVGNSSFLLNAGLLTATNYIQFPKILGSSAKLEKGMVSAATKEIGEVAKDAAGNLIVAPARYGKVLGFLGKVRPYTFSVAEGFEEGAQFAISSATQDYYNKKLKGDATSFLDSLTEGVSKTLTTNEGMENILIGGLSGALMTARGRYKEEKEKASDTAKFVTEANKYKISDFTKETIDSVNRGTVIQEERERYLQQGDTLMSKEAERDYIINYLTPRIKYGRLDLVKSDVADLRLLASTEDGFNQLVQEGKALNGDTREAYLQRLTNLEATAKSMDSLHQSLTLRYGNLVNEKNQPLYNQEVMTKMIYAATKVADYDVRIPQLTQDLSNENISVYDVINDIAQGKEESFNKALADIDALGVIGDKKIDLKIALQDVKDLTQRRQEFLKEYDEIKKSPEKYSTPVLTEEEKKVAAEQVGQPKKTVNIKTKDGEEEVEIGTEYFLGRVVEKDKNNKDVYRAPKLTILGENEDGTIKIKDSNGIVRDVAKSVLADYKLGKVSDTLANKKAKFFMDHWNTMYEFNFGKGKKVKGRLEYSDKDKVLIFVYRNNKGQRKELEVTADQFVAKKGFSNPMIKAIGELTAVQKKAMDEFTAEKDERTTAKRESRLKILSDLFDEVSNKLDSTKNLLQQKYSQFEKIVNDLTKLEEQIKVGELTKTNTFKKTTNNAIKAANRLSRMQEQLRLEIANLEAERSESEMTLEWISDLVDNIDELPTDSKEFLAELKDQRDSLESLILESGKTINDLSDLINRAEDALQSAIDLLKRWVNQFEQAYPKVPTNLGQEWVDFLKANPNFLKLAPKFKDDLAMLEDMISQIEDFTIKPTEEEVATLRDELEKVQSSLKEAEQQLKIKDLIVSRFEQVAKEYQKQEEQKARILKNEALIAEVLGSADPGLQTRPYDSAYEPSSKKSNISVVTGTKVPSKSDQPHVKRANLFGIKLPNLKNKNKIKGVVVSAKNEADFGLSGLTQHLKDVSDATEAEKAKIDPSKTVVLVMVVETKSGSYVPVDVNGEPIEDISVENAIYQVFPDPKLEWSEQYGGGTMFREGTPEETINYYKKQYGEWHQEMLDAPTNLPHSIQASFGKPQIPERLNEKGEPQKIYETRTPVADAGLINESSLQTAPVVYVPTTNNVVSKGSTFFDSPLGRPFLSLANAYVKLMNRKLTSNEASTIYEAIYRLSLDIDKNGNAKSEESKRLINWLKSIIYWGTPKNAAGYNSVFFDRTEEGLKVFFSGKEKSYFFTPQSIKDNKGDIITILESMYNNVNSGLTDKDNVWDQPYEEIIGFDKDGTPIVREVDGNPYWPNYQTYLLSGKGRKPEEIPLTTQMRPLENESDVNRDGIYFTITDTADTERYNKPPKAGSLTPVVPGAKPTIPAASAPATPVVTAKATGDYKFDASEETIAIVDKVGDSVGDAKFSVDLDKYEKSNGEDGFDITPQPDTIEKLMAKKGISEDAARSAIASYVKSKVEPFIKAKIEARKAPAPVQQTAPVSTDAKADIERRREAIASIKLETRKVMGQEESYYISNEPSEFEGTNIGGFTKQEVIDKINAKYDKLAALEGAKPAEQAAPVAAAQATTTKIREQMRNMSSKTPLRKKIEKEIKNFKPENWNKVEKWLKANFPNIPVYRVKNIIQATNGQQAWGMFKDGAIYIYENAEVGTAYHEVFHAVWRMFSDPVEQAAVIAEIKARKGMENATEEEIEELLAEEFRDYVQFKKIPGKPKSGRSFIIKLFNDLVDIIKGWFKSKKDKSKTEQLFKKIGSGYYAKYNPYHASLAFAKQGIIDVEEAYASSDSAFRIKDIPADKVNAIMQQMTYTTLTDLIRDNKSLFTIPKLKDKNKTMLYERLREDMQETALQSAKSAEALVEQKKITDAQAQPFYDSSFALWKSITDNWEDIKAKHEEYLKTYNIEFDENDQAQLVSDERGKETGWMDATKIDAFKKANGAIKLLLSTIPIVNDKNDFIYSSINGVTLLPTSQVYMSLMNNLHTSRTIDEMMDRLREMAEKDPNYRTLYSRLTNTPYSSDTLDLSDINEVHDGQLLAAFWRTFKKQNPDVKNVYIFENGDIEVGDASLSSAAKQVANEYVENFKEVLTSANPYFTYSSERKAYIGKPEGIADIKESFRKTQSDSELLDKMISFLKTIGIDFKKEEIVKLPGDKQESFKASVNGIIASIEKSKNIATISGKVLDLQGRFMGLSTLRALINNPEFDSTFFNVKGERVQSFIGTNLPSDLFDVLSQIENKEQLVGTPYEYLLTDELSQGSVILDKMFNKETGERKALTAEIMKPGYVDGTINQQNGKKKESSKLTFKERLVQEINMNLKGFYYNLVPGDASIEWMLYMTNHVTPDSLLSGFARVNEIFKGYFLSELALSRSDRKIVAMKGRKSTDLRFFKPILGEELHDEIVKQTGTPEEVYARYANKINKAIENFIIKDAENTKAVLFEYGILKSTETGYAAENIGLSERESMSEAVLNRQMNAIAANYIINNIELHKLIYSDPYQYKDELKRIKNFNSPRQAIISGSKKMNAAFNKIWNRGYSGIGVTKFDRDYFRTATLEDAISTSDLKDYGEYEETDGGGVITFKANRNFRIRAGEWNDDEEMQFMYDVAYEKVVKGKELTKEESQFLDDDGKIDPKKNPNVKSAYTPIKPIVSGNKGNGKSYNDIMLDKFALYPMSFRIMHQLNPNSNAIKQYDKMQAEDIDYVVFATGRKVGAEALNPIYNEDGSFNNESYEGIINVPFSIISIQSEVPSKDDNMVTRGSQITKLATMDYMEAGVPVDFNSGGKFEERFKQWQNLKTEEQKEAASPLYKEIKNNQLLLEEIMQEGYDQLLKEMGITESIVNKKKSFKITNFEKAAKTLREEIMKREVNDNISDALEGFLNGEAVLEATPAYQQVRNILYSIADKRVISPKMSGGQKVQIPSTFFEENRLKAEGKAGKVFSSDVLGFYKDEDGKRVCEIMVGRWFKSNLSDEQLLEYLNNTPEGQKVLAGVAFRIPTQKQNSIDVFKIKRFIPREFGDSVVIPSQLVKKAGSDFDIDKLSIYFKNVLVNAKGEPKIVPFFGYGEQAKKKISEWLITNELETLFDVNKEDPEAIENLSVEDEEKDLADLDKYYKKSLENAYVESLEKLISHPSNFDRLVAPNSADQLKTLSSKITKKLGFESFDYSSTSNMLSRRFMSRMRHAFVTGKYAIGIAAVNQTSHSLNQRQPIYIDINRFDNLNDIDKYWLTKGTGKREDIDIKFDKFNRLEVDNRMVPTLSMIRNAAGQDISDINGQFIDGYVDISKGPWIMELGATPNVASTWLFLVKLGVPINSVAYFMNQPIIRDYLRSIESAGYSYLFMEDFVDNIYSSPKYKVEGSANLKTIPSDTEMFEMIGKKDFNSAEKLTQKFVLGEFLKYAKLAEQMFNVTQGSNFDTATFNDPSLVFKKEMQLIKARASIISSVDDLLKNSFVGSLRGKIIDIKGALGTMLKSEDPEVSDVINTVLMDYIDLSDRDFVQVARKVVNDLFDWAVQVNTKLNTQVQNILLSEDNAAKQITDFIRPIVNNDEHPLSNNLVVKSLVPKFADAKDSRKPNNLKIKNKDNKIYDQNQMIYAFQELRDYLKGENSPLYGKLIRLAVLQSGLSNSPISFTSLIPYEDFKTVYNKTLSTLESTPGLINFAKLNVFQRNNWSNNDLVPYRKGKLKFNPAFGTSYYSELSFGSKDVLNAGIKSGKVPQVIKLYTKSAQADSDIVVYSWEVGTSKEKKKKRAEGDFSFIKKGLFKKVYSGNDPLIYPDKRGNPQYIYKMINAWGDGIRANEFYDNVRKSVIDNGFIPVENEVSDGTIISYFEATAPLSSEPAAAPTVTASENEVKIAELKTKIELFETMVQNGVAGPDEYKTIDYLYKELGKLIKLEC